MSNPKIPDGTAMFLNAMAVLLAGWLHGFWGGGKKFTRCCRNGAILKRTFPFATAYL